MPIAETPKFIMFNQIKPMFTPIKTILAPICERLDHPSRHESEPVKTGGSMNEEVTVDYCNVCDKVVETHKYIII